METLPEIVKRAMIRPITDIGQINKKDKYHLNRFVMRGVLVKSKGGPFPKLKTVYALIGHDIAKDRKDFIDKMLIIAEFESKRKR